MRIAVFVYEFPVLSETFILNQITGLIDRGHTVDIYANRRGDTEKIHPDVISYKLLERTNYLLEVPRDAARRYLGALWTLSTCLFTNPRVFILALRWGWRGEPGFSLGLLHSVKRLLPRRSYDLMHCHFGPSGVRGALLKGLGVLRGKLVTTYYGHDVSSYVLKFGRDVYQRLFDTGDLFLVLSERMKRRVVELGCNEHRVMVHHLGVDCRRFPFAPRESHANQPLHVLTISRFVEKKGLEYAVGAVAKLVDAGLKVEHRIVGSGPLFDRIRELIQQHGLEHCVHLLGWKSQDEVVALLADADVLLAPSVTSSDGDEEGTPTVLMEAMAWGLPVVSTYHSGIPELVTDGVTGCLVPERDVDALAEKLTYLIENPQLWAEMGRKGRAFVEQHFDIEKLNDRLVELYEQLVKGSQAT